MNRKALLLCVLLIVSFVVGVATAVVYYEKVVKVSWRVVESEGIEVFPDGLMLGDIEEGESASSTFTVRNVSGETLSVTMIWPVPLCACDIKVEPSVFILQPGKTRVVTVTVTGGLAGHQHIMDITIRAEVSA